MVPYVEDMVWYHALFAWRVEKRERGYVSVSDPAQPQIR